MTFHPHEALSAAKLCLSAYGEPDAQFAPNIRRANAQALVLTTPLRVAIAGTNGWQDAKQDADFDLVRVGAQERVHEGFLGHYKTLADDVTAMATAKPIDAPPLITGHSLGASVTVLTVWHRTYLFKNGTVYLFGCPGTGDWAFTQSFEFECKRNNITVWRIVNLGDPVAAFDAGRYCHVGQLVEIGTRWDRKPDHPIREYIRELEAMV